MRPEHAADEPVEAACPPDLVRAQVQAGAVEERSGLSKAEAEDLLDALENQGCTRREVGSPDGKTFTVRWERPGPAREGGHPPSGIPGVDPGAGGGIMERDDFPAPRRTDGLDNGARKDE